ncbi:MAG TPA: T9SS type A sorting domain-containing protein [Bacteroidia bacterium]|nr:T9SS type A sorting domain-containing protein [Bacteroidia bacterium]
MKNWLTIVVYLFPSVLFAQGNPFAIWENQVTSTYWFVTLDAATGTKTDISPIAGVTAFVAGHATAFNTDKMHYHFTGMDGATKRFYTIDAVSGNVVYSPVMTSTVVGIHYNCNDSALYGMKVTGNFYELVSVNPLSGATAVIAPVTGITAYVAESFSFNPHLQQLTMIVYSGNYYLRSYNVITGTLVNNHLFPDNVTALRYSCADSSLYGLWENAGVYKLEKINSSTGAHSTVNTLAGVVPGYVAESACINISGNYIYRGFDAGNNFSLISIDASTGTVINVVNTSDNAAGFEEGICCYDSQATFTGKDVVPENLNFYPSPFTDRIHISGSSSVYRVQLFSGCGKRLYDMKTETHTTEHVLQVPFLPAGIYFLKILFSDGTMVTGKLARE